MHYFANCPACGSALPPEAPGGLCPPCLLLQGLARDESLASGDWKAAAFEPGEPGALAGPSSRLGSISRLLLREARAEENHRPVVRPWSTEMPAPAHRGDRYQLLGEIARGGMGAVLKGRDPDLGRDLAIKVLLDEHRDQPELVRRFVEEAQIGGQLQHPGIVPVYELSQFGDRRPYFAMKLVEGRTLAALLAERVDITADLARLFDIFAQVCQTVAYAHARGVIHRDLKPSNIMVGNFGEIQVMDWGLAKVLSRGGLADELPVESVREPAPVRTARNSSDAGISRAGSVLGTPAYMAPEQARGDLEDVDERADVFGLGAILCEILTGRPPYVGSDARMVRGLAARAELGEALERLRDCGVDRELIALCRRCLAARPEERPRDAGMVASAITAYLRGMRERLKQAELERVKAQAKATEEKSRRRLTVGLAAAIVGLVVTVGAGGAWALQQHHVRAARVDHLITEARLLEAQADAAGDDLARWAAAREAVRRLVPMMEDARDAATRRRAAALRTQVETLADAAEADARLVRRLAEVREAIDEIPAAETEAAYAAAFQAAGLVPDTDPSDEIGRAIANRPPGTAVALAVALDHWAALRRDLGDRSSADRITAVTRAADPDLYRGRLRTALMEPNADARRAALRELARSGQGAELPPVTSALLGAGLLHAGDPIAAESVLRPAQRRHPADPWLAQVLARTLEKQSRRPEAIRYYFIARAAQPESAHALAHALERQGERTEAVAVFREAVRLNPTSARHMSCLARALESQGHTQEANETFDAAIAAGCEALRLGAGHSVHHALTGIVVHRPKRRDDVIAAYQNAIRLRPDDAAAHFYLGTMLARARRPDDAIAEFRQAIRLKPDFAPAYNGLGLVLSKLKRDHDGAISVLRDLIRLGPDDPLAHVNLGSILREQGRVDDAIGEYRAAIRLKPDFAEAYCDLGAILSGDKSKHDEARTALVEAIRLRPDDALAHCNLATSLRLSGRFDEALVEYHEALRLAPRLPQAHFGKGDLLRRQGLADLAIAEYREAIRLDPGRAEVHSDLAHLLGARGRYAESIVEFERAHTLGSRQPDWAYPIERWLARARRLAQLAPELPALIRGDAQPASAAQCLDVAAAAHNQGLHAAAARLFAQAFAADPTAVDDLEASARYNAACSAALAGCGNGKDQPSLEEAAKVVLRMQALDWLTADLAARSRVAASGARQEMSVASRRLVDALEHWKHDSDLAGVRERDALNQFEQSEQDGWRALWAEVDRLLARFTDASH
jgi:serine/threonine protein kinase/Flp pilus assembly protein TadD